MTFALRIAFLVILGASFSAMAELTPEQVRQLPPASAQPVEFVRDIQPIFEASCVQCHARGKDKGGFSLETREKLLAGGDSGEAIVVRNSAASHLIETISGLNPDNVMPQKGTKLTAEQVSIVRAWIDQGAPWPAGLNFFKHEPANLKPAELQSAATRSGEANPLDGLLDRHFKANGLRWPKPVDDRTFARRVWLDALGVLPSPEDLEGFVADRSPGKRARLVHWLLGDDQAYAEHWLTFWNDLLRNDYRGTGYIDGGRKQITSWLYAALAQNLPYDRFVAQLVNPNAESEGFTRGIVWRGAVNASMVPPMQAAQGISQVFLGVNLKCASCHDSFINEYTLKDAYGMAAVYADGPLEIAECDKPSGHMAQVKFLYGELGVIDANADSTTRKRQLADLLTGRNNGRLPRTIVNRLWQRFMGRGLVEPVDEMDKPAWSPEVLNFLAEDLVASGFDLRHTMERILTSRAYALPSVALGETDEGYVFRGPGVKRMSAEQFIDAVMRVGGVTFPRADASLNRVAALGAPAPRALPLEPKWIWSTADADQKATPATVTFVREVVLPVNPTEAVITLAADNRYTLTINGARVAASNNSISADFHDVRRRLKKGTNTISVAAVNLQPNGRNPVPAELTPESDNPAGLILYARVRAGSRVMDFVTDSQWTVGARKQATHVIELGSVDMAPWRLGERFLQTASASADSLPVERSALVVADPLMVALGRPNREQIVTVRQQTATTLQALELTNGETLNALLKRAAAHLAGDEPEAGALVQSVYARALGRAPSRAEQRLALELVRSPVEAAGVEDLLWSIAMLPEFQLIW